MQKGHYSACSASLTASPRWLDAQNLRILSFCSYYIGRDDLVLTATGQILKTVPGDAEALYWRIQSVERLGLAALTTASGISPESASLHALSGDMLREKGDLASAADEYRKAIAVSPGFLAAHLGLARVLNSDHNTNEAEHELQYVLKANPDDPEANYLMGEIMVNRMNLADALAFLLKGLYVTPEERPYVHADLSRVYEDRGEVQKAIDEMKQALPLDVDGSYYFRLGRLYMKMGDRVNAALALDQSAKLRHEADAASMFVK
jgi:predicted Zn-dependent protease